MSQTSTNGTGLQARSHGGLRRPDPFRDLGGVPVPGGILSVGQAGPPPREAEAVVLAVHGVTSSHLAWRTVARELNREAAVALLAPDLRGRGRSAAVGGPFGARTHIDDLLRVLDAAGVERAILAGHSMGAYLAARLAADHPDRAAAVVLVDGGPYIPVPPDEDPDALLAVVVEQLTSRLQMTFDSADEYVARWSAHPALRREWNDDLEAYARFELDGPAGAMRCTVSEEALVADCTDMMQDESTLRALDRVTAPLYLARAERGLLDDQPVLSDAVVEAFVAAHPDARVEYLLGTNHYTVVLGSGSGPRRVAALITAAIPHAVRAGALKLPNSSKFAT